MPAAAAARPHVLTLESVIRYLTVLAVAVLAATASVPSTAQAQSDPYHITALEKAACTSDAVRLCSNAYPDEHKLMSCMVENRASLTRVCLVVFDAGLKRRHLVAR